jgi:peptide/nickel transport system substrate-binding protein
MVCSFPVTEASLGQSAPDGGPGPKLSGRVSSWILELVPLIAAGALLASGCSHRDRGTTAGHEITFTVGVPQSRQSGDFGIEQLVRAAGSEGLTRVAHDGRPLPLLAEGWTMSADGLEWRLALRPGVRFHDGTVLDARVVKESLDSWLNRAPRPPGLSDVEDVREEGPLALSIRLARPSAFLLEELSQPVVRRDGRDRPVGTGPFIEADRTDGHITLLANPDYHSGRPEIDRVVMKPHATIRAAWAEMMRGDIDLMHDLGHEAVEFVEAVSSVRVFSYLRPYVYAVVFNMRHPTLREPLVRRALNIAVDRQAVVLHALKGRGDAASGPVWPVHWAMSQDQEGYSHAPERASAILAALPSPSQSHGEPPTVVSFTCLVPDGFTVHERIALLIQRQLHDIGVRMQLEALPPDELSKRVQAGTFDAVLLDLVAGPIMATHYRFWHSSTLAASWNHWNYASSRVDAALDDMRVAKDEEAFRAAVARFHTALHEDPPAIFLAWRRASQALSHRFDAPSHPEWDLLRALPRLRPCPSERCQ